MSEENAGTGENQETATEDESLETSEAATETAEGDESEAKPSKAAKRIQELISQRDKAHGVAEWYQKNIGDPSDVVEFRKWKASQVEKAEKAEDEGEISKAKLAEIKKLMRKADPEYAQYLEESKAEKQERIEAQFDAAEDTIRELAATEFGLKGKADEDTISWLAQQTMLAIKNDTKLSRMWAVGNSDCLKKGFKIVQDRQERLGKSVTKMKAQAQEKRKISRLPTLPSVQGTGSGKEGKSGQQEKGITKQTHDDAWALLQQSMQD